MATDKPYFSFEGDIKPVPAEPTHCRRCRTELEPLRRWGGLCLRCVAARARPAPLPTEQLRCRFTVVRSFYRQRAGHRERYVEVRCECGQRRTYKQTIWMHHRPKWCKRCRLRAGLGLGVDR
jgi:hypothetical protein